MNLRYPAVVACALALSLPVVLSSCGGRAHTPTAARNAAPAQQVPRESIEDTIANYLAGLAKDKAKNFIIEQLGLKPPSELDKLSAQIRALSAQLQATEARLSAQIEELSLQGRIDYLQDKARDLDSMYRDYFLPLVAAGTELRVEQEKKPPDQAAIAAAMARYNARKARFENFADAIKVTTLTNKIHDRLQPGFGLRGVLREYGALIMAKHRIVNLGDSQRVAAMYTFLEEHQALATWMSVESELAVAGDYEHAKSEVDGFLDNFVKLQSQQRDPNASNGLLPPIPPGVAIDRGADTSTSLYTTKNRPMFTLIGGTYGYPPWSSAGLPYVQGAVARANASMLRGFTGWGVPDGGQVDDLFKPLGPKTPASITAYIDDAFGHPNTPTPRPWIWISNTTTQHYCYDTPTHKLHCTTSDSHAGKSTDNFSSEVHPRIAQYGGPPPNLTRIYSEATGGLILVRNTGEAGDYL